MSSEINNRYPFIDYLRGISLFGILIVNIWVFSMTFIGYDMWREHFTSLDNVLLQASAFLFEQRFVGIFSILLGIGITIQMERFQHNQKGFTVYYFKRIFAFAIMGILNIILFFWGDILLIYAELMVLLFYFLKLQPRQILLAAILVYWIPVILFLIPSIKEFFHHHESLIGLKYTPELLIKTYQSGSFTEISMARINEYIAFNALNIMYLRTSFAMILFGVFIGKRKFYFLSENLIKIQKPYFFTSLVVGIGIIFISTNGNGSFTNSPWFHLLYNLLLLLTIYIYISVATLFYEIKYLKKLNQHIIHLGRLSLSNYFLQSVICSILFTNIGFSFFFKTSPTINFIIAIAIYITQLYLSSLYLKYAKKGPLETLLRWFTN